MLIGGVNRRLGILGEVTEYGESGLVRELPKLLTARYKAACGAMGQVGG